MDNRSSNDIQTQEQREQWVKPEVQVFDAKKDIAATASLHGSDGTLFS